DQASPEFLRAHVPDQLRDFPVASETGEDFSGGARADPEPAILTQYEELADLARSHAGEGRAVANEDEAREASLDADGEVVLPAAQPEAPVPGATEEPAVDRDVPVVAAEI